VAAEQVPTVAEESDLATCASCSEHEHSGGAAAIDTEACERAAAIFRALGDPQRLRILVMLEDSERCVSELCQALQDNMPAISQRLRLLKAERIVRARRDGKHIFYALADNHIARLVTNGLLHALEETGPRGGPAAGGADDDSTRPADH
jgi:ArsR family transcriptional regulator, lead/cadmium/zinc/bismuth-responsive transcriptional repressor